MAFSTPQNTHTSSSICVVCFQYSILKIKHFTWISFKQKKSIANAWSTRKNKNIRKLKYKIFVRNFPCFYIGLSSISLGKTGQDNITQKKYPWITPWSPEGDICSTSCCKTHSRFYCCYGYSKPSFQQERKKFCRSLQHIVTQLSHCPHEGGLQQHHPKYKDQIKVTYVKRMKIWIK